MSLLNPARLRSEVEAREARKIKVFEHILEMCYNKITTTNQQTDDCCCIFTCPGVVFGMPLFNLMDCIRFIMIKLVEKGFEVHLAIPNNIFISWKKESDPENSRRMYQLTYPTYPAYPTQNTGSQFPVDKPRRLGLEYGSGQGMSVNSGEYKLFSSRSGSGTGSKKEKEKNYRPIEDYRQTKSSAIEGSYSIDDIDLFHSKLDQLLS